MKCLALFSGGLDSMLACKVISEQGIEVIALHIDTGFGGKDNEEKTKKMRERAEKAGAKLEIIDVRQQYIDEILFHPKYGYGKHFNPCIDCHAFMFRTALGLLEKFDAKFIITGEVLAQRPMSQRKEALNTVKNLAEDKENLLLRPLSALLLEPTKPEQEGWVNREKLLALSGRGRKPQLALAKNFGFDDFESPAGGCLLTMEVFSNKMKDFLAFNKDITLNEALSLKYARHFRLPDGAKLIVGRDEVENEILSKLLNTEKYEKINLENTIGAASFLSQKASQEDKNLAAKIALSYSKAQGESKLKIGEESFLTSPFEDKKQALEFLVK